MFEKKNALLIKSNKSAVLADKVQDMTDRYDYILLQTCSVKKNGESGYRSQYPPECKAGALPIELISLPGKPA